LKLLAVDTALGACSVALLEGDRVLAHRHQLMDRGHAEALAPMVEDAMRDAGTGFATLGRLAVTTGPGTFTGQRVGLAFMRGLRIALRIPLVGITTLAAMAQAAKAETGLAHAIALHDARRNEVYIEIDDTLPPAVMLFEEAVALLGAVPGDEPIAIAGTAASRVCDALAKRVVLSSVRQPDALWVARLAMNAEISNSPPRPLYLRAPDAKLPAART
jgi:tRNA threonylcarbamoyladenosine biosynthesis protein TsaB